MSAVQAGTSLIPYSGTIGAHRVGAQEHGEYGRHEGGGYQQARSRDRVRRISTLDSALDEFGGLYIELAPLPDGNIGYLVTINNEIPGIACKRLTSAIKSAIAALGERECARGGRA